MMTTERTGSLNAGRARKKGREASQIHLAPQEVREGGKETNVARNTNMSREVQPV